MIEKCRRFLECVAFDPAWTCTLCGAEIFEGYFCAACENDLPFNDGAICSHCGRKLETTAPVCGTCKNRLTDLDAGRSVFLYEGTAAELIKRFKYANERYLARVFAVYLAKLYEESGFVADAAVSVPMLEEDEKKRGYNQTVLLAEAFSAMTGLPALSPLVKKKTTEHQSQLSGRDRLKNLESAFKVSGKDSVEGRSLIIVDDVTTTGATLQAVAKELKRNGAARVYALTAASVPADKEIRQ